MKPLNPKELKIGQYLHFINDGDGDGDGDGICKIINIKPGGLNTYWTVKWIVCPDSCEKNPGHEMIIYESMLDGSEIIMEEEVAIYKIIKS